jgi:hypothetical protein
MDTIGPVFPLAEHCTSWAPVPAGEVPPYPICGALHPSREVVCERDEGHSGEHSGHHNPHLYSGLMTTWAHAEVPRDGRRPVRMVFQPSADFGWTLHCAGGTWQGSPLDSGKLPLTEAVRALLIGETRCPADGYGGDERDAQLRGFVHGWLADQRAQEQHERQRRGVA